MADDFVFIQCLAMRMRNALAQDNTVRVNVVALPDRTRLPDATHSTQRTMASPTEEKKSKFTYRHLQQLSKYSVDSPLRVIALVFASRSSRSSSG
jgi:hypothetical protein